MVVVSKSQFKARALDYFRQVERGEELVVTDHGHKVIRISRYTSDDEAELRSLRGLLEQYDDPFAPVDEDAWEALR